MISDEVSVYNLALNAIGARNNVGATTEASREAEVCRLWYAVVRDQILAAAHWPSARTFARLAQAGAQRDVWQPGDPEPGFLYSFFTPSDMLRPQYLTSYSRFTLTVGNKVNSRNIATETGSPIDTEDDLGIAVEGGVYTRPAMVISCDDCSPVLAYTTRQKNVALWDSELQMAVIYGLAAQIARPLTGKAQLSQSLVNQANALVMAARVGAANTDEDFKESIPDWLAVRGYTQEFPRYQFLYNHGPLLSLFAPGSSAVTNVPVGNVG